MVKMTIGMRKNDFNRHFWLNMRNMVTKKQTIQQYIWYN